MDQERITIKTTARIKAAISLPGSKSITNRALLIAALSDGRSLLSGVLDSIDTNLMQQALVLLGIKITKTDTGKLAIIGGGGRFAPRKQAIYIENAGTAARFLTVALLLGQGEYLLTGNQRMQERPIIDLLSALKANGAQIKSLHQTDRLPLKIKATGYNGGEITVRGVDSSQYVSALMLSAPFASRPVRIIIEQSLVSRGYVNMTAQLMRDFGAEVLFEGHKIEISNQQRYQGQSYGIEVDLSSASYFLAATAIVGGEIFIRDLKPTSLQSDHRFISLLVKMGCNLTWHADGLTLSSNGKLQSLGEIDMHHISDVVPTLAVVAIFASGRTRIVNVRNMRLKESDRIAALYRELSKIGADVTELDDGLVINGYGQQATTRLNGAVLSTYDDHRLAMSFSLLGLKISQIVILNPDCVSKTVPNFFKLLAKISN